MSSTPNITPAEALTALRAEIRQRTQLVRLITSLQEEIAYDRICGSWLSTENNLSATIRRICTRTYRMLIFDNTLCYRRLVQDTVITAERRSLLFGSRDDPRDMHPHRARPRERHAAAGLLRTLCLGGAGLPAFGAGEHFRGVFHGS